MGLINKVPDALWRSIPEDPTDTEFDGEITIFEAHALVLNRSQAATREEEKDGETPEEEVGLHDVWDELSDQNRAENLENIPIPISGTEIVDAQRIDNFFKEILPRRDPGTSVFVETEDEVPRRLSQDDGDNFQIITPEVLRPRLQNCWHPGQKIMYTRLNQRFYCPQVAGDVATTMKRCVFCEGKD